MLPPKTLRFGSLFSAALVASASCGKSDSAPTAAAAGTVATVTIVQSAPITLNAVGATVVLSAIVRSADGTTLDGIAVTWVSDNQSVASVSASGVVAAVSPGTANIRASAGTVQSAPVRITVTGVQNGAAVYVLNGGTGAAGALGSVSVVSPSTNAVLTTIPVGERPSRLVLSPNGALLYAINTGGNSVSVIATGTSAVVATISVGSTPVDGAFTPDGARAYVANALGQSLSVVATATHAVSSTIPLGHSPRRLAITPNGSFIYVANEAYSNASPYPGHVSVIAVASNTVVASTIVEGPRTLAITPDGSRVFVWGSGLAVFETATHTRVQFGGGRFNPPPGTLIGSIAITPDGQSIYLADSHFSQVEVKSVATATGVNINVGQRPGELRISRDGTRVYVANTGATTVSAINTASNTVAGTIDVGGAPAGLAVSPDGSILYVAVPQRGSVVAISTASLTVLQTIATGVGALDVVAGQ